MIGIKNVDWPKLAKFVTIFGIVQSSASVAYVTGIIFWRLFQILVLFFVAGGIERIEMYSIVCNYTTFSNLSDFSNFIATIRTGTESPFGTMSVFKISTWRYLTLFQILTMHIFQIIAGVNFLTKLKLDDPKMLKKSSIYLQAVSVVPTILAIYEIGMSFGKLDVAKLLLFISQTSFGLQIVIILHVLISRIEIPDTIRQQKDIFKLMAITYLIAATMETILWSFVHLLKTASTIKMCKDYEKSIHVNTNVIGLPYLHSEIIMFTLKSVSWGINIASGNLFVAGSCFKTKRHYILRLLYTSETFGVIIETLLTTWSAIPSVVNSRSFDPIWTWFIIGYSIQIGRVCLMIFVYRRTHLADTLLFKNVKKYLANNSGRGLFSNATLKKQIINSRFIDVDYSSKLGEGFFGSVFKGNLKLHKRDYEIAVKLCKEVVEGHEEFGTFCDEAKIAWLVGEHPNVVGFYGISAYGSHLLMMFEHCENGSLEKFLRDMKLKPGCFNKTYTQTAQYVNDLQISQETSSQLRSFSRQISLGMEHLASKNIIHGDLATRNVLLTHDCTVKLTDFGLSRKLTNYQTYIRADDDNLCLPWRWMAVETLRDLKFSKETDIYSYGVVLWEIFSLGCVPYRDMIWCANFISQLENGLILDCPMYASLEMYDLMKSCWNLDPKLRPTFSNILDDHFKEKHSRISEA